MGDPGEDFLRELLAYGMIAGAALPLAALALWAAPYMRRRPLPLSRLRPGRWRGAEVVFAFLAMLVAQHLAVGLLVEDTAGPAEARRTQLNRLLVVSSPMWVTLTLALITTVLFAISRTRPHQYGVTWARWPANGIVGYVQYLVVAPLTLGAYSVTLLVFSGEVNPIESLVKQGFEPWEWALLVFMTVIGAPLTEEILFRGVLLGWLRRASLLGHGVLLMVLFSGGALPALYYLAARVEGPEQDTMRALAPPDVVGAIAPLVFSGLLVAGYLVWMSRLWSRYRGAHSDLWQWRPDVDPQPADGESAPQRPASARQHEWAWANARLAAYGSGALFALAHGWPNSVPLLLLGTALGWLAYRTQSLVGCIVCHALFNAIACLVLAWSV